jgi:hypothetical protein
MREQRILNFTIMVPYRNKIGIIIKNVGYENITHRRNCWVAKQPYHDCGDYRAKHDKKIH